MNVQQFYQEIFEDTLGLDVMGLENEFRDLVNLVETKTMMTMANMIPVKYKIYLDLLDKSHIVPKDHPTNGIEYYLSDPVLDKYGLSIMGVDSINYCNNSATVDPYDPDSAAYYSSVIASRNNVTFESVLMGPEYTYNRTLIDFGLPFKRYHELRGSNVLYLQNYTFDGTVEVVCRVGYPNIVSVPEEYRQEYVKMALFDIKIKLWNELKYIENVVTPSGNSELKISDWESAERDREEYLRELRTRTFPDRVFASYFQIV